MYKKMCLFLLLLPLSVYSQTGKTRFVSRTHHEFGAMLSTDIGMSSLAISHRYYWGLGRKDKKFKFGLGMRLTSAFGKGQDLYITAPAVLTSGKTGPGVFFADQVHQNIDTLILHRTQNFMLNASLALCYDLTSKWGAEFNIDLAGISGGPAVRATLYYKEGKKTSPFVGDPREQYTYASPTLCNVLLISDNDIGSLNSELFVSYKIKPAAKIKAGLSFLFNEYKVHSPVSYTNSIGTFVNTDRYRKKSLMFAVGASVLINKKSHVKKSKSAS